LTPNAVDQIGHQKYNFYVSGYVRLHAIQDTLTDFNDFSCSMEKVFHGDLNSSVDFGFGLYMTFYY